MDPHRALGPVVAGDRHEKLEAEAGDELFPPLVCVLRDCEQWAFDLRAHFSPLFVHLFEDAWGEALHFEMDLIEPQIAPAMLIDHEAIVIGLAKHMLFYVPPIWLIAAFAARIDF